MKNGNTTCVCHRHSSVRRVREQLIALGPKRLHKDISLADCLYGAGIQTCSGGIATGSAGIGKTVALSCLHHTLAREEMHSAQSSLVLTASPFLTPSRLVSQLLQLLDASPDHPGHSLSAMLRKQGIRLVSIDNADLLRTETWKMLHMLSDEAPCSLLLVGHPVLYRHLEQHPKPARKESSVVRKHSNTYPILSKP
jgi:DNA transposition AAA+ family ATPase